MSKHINVNPGQYYEGGRERQGEEIVHATERQRYEQGQTQQRAGADVPQIPNQERASEPVAEGPDSGERSAPEDDGEATPRPSDDDGITS